jgi:hypothetical protein
MNSIVCTLFEGHYHYGVASLTNSLYKQGYRGVVYAGYRGKLPAWAAAATENSTVEWQNIRSLEVCDGLKVCFILLDTDYHLTNYKPDFMLHLWNTLANEAEAMFYFDPDIVVTTPWLLFEEWVNCGVALCEDVNSPIAEHHPTRTAWRRYFGAKHFTLRFKDAIYANGGFVGVSKGNYDFLVTWQKLQEAMAPAIGGLNQSAFTSVTPLPFAPFGKTDQDALNASVEAWEGNVSFVGKEGMAFNTSMPLMSHALGKLKPWLWKPLVQVVDGRPPRKADRDYWSLANGPIMSQPASLIKRRQLAIKVAALVGRFYSRK